MSSLVQNIIRMAVLGVVLTALVILGNVLNNFLLVEYLTQFFVLVRTITKPLAFLWDFDTSFQLMGYSISVLISYWGIKAILTIKNYFFIND